MRLLEILSPLYLFGLLVSLSSTPAQAAGPGPISEVGFDQKLNAALPLDVPLLDESGRSIMIGDLFGKKPVLLLFAYYDCPMLCSLVFSDLTRSLVDLDFDAGKEFDVVAISIDPGETPELAAQKKSALLSEYARPGAEAGWHFLTGDQSSIDRLAMATGFRYAYDEQLMQYAHPTGLILLTPDGRISGYLFGLNYSPVDLRLGLVEASANKIGTLVDRVYLLCYEYDPSTGTYGLLISNVLKLAGIATILSIGGLVALMLIRERGIRHIGDYNG